MMATTAEERQTKLNGPAMAPPSGVIPNFVDPPNIEHVIILVLVLCVVLQTLALLMRIYTKVFIIRKMAVEDCMSSSAVYLSPRDIYHAQMS